MDLYSFYYIYFLRFLQVSHFDFLTLIIYTGIIFSSTIDSSLNVIIPIEQSLSSCKLTEMHNLSTSGIRSIFFSFILPFVVFKVLWMNQKLFSLWCRLFIPSKTSLYDKDLFYIPERKRWCTAQPYLYMISTLTWKIFYFILSDLTDYVPSGCFQLLGNTEIFSFYGQSIPNLLLPVSHLYSHCPYNWIHPGHPFLLFPSTSPSIRAFSENWVFS